jgi:hypothetical protein
METRLLTTTGLNRILFSVFIGIAVAALAFLIGPRVPWISGILGCPGILVSWLGFGPHSSGPSTYAFIVDTVFWSILTFLVFQLKKLSARNKGWWPSAKS